MMLRIVITNSLTKWQLRAGAEELKTLSHIKAFGIGIAIGVLETTQPTNRAETTLAICSDRYSNRLLLDSSLQLSLQDGKELIDA
jgi:hypothetical protein